ncbi:hypothetical protein Ddye_013794 [Dipteronia dyeriana]|uniref:RNase H type-1 domain-containing protein n=1 Tax=Dipteronia dyeriana TaxID=168575 RepID=A0AAE0CKI9_9ROSI|nr:hypothetical protein Ddye_013794 [Dipteronia dyeriana]
MEYLINTRRILRCFEVASGLRINFHKSCVVRVGKEMRSGVEWAANFRCKQATLPITYLGLKLGGRPCSKKFWSDLIRFIPPKIKIFAWQLLQCRVMVNEVMLKFGLQDWWKGWSHLCPKKNSKRAWLSLFFAIVWSILEARNGRVFQSEDADPVKALDMIKFRVTWWYKHFGKGVIDPISLLLLDVACRCVYFDRIKNPKKGNWIHPESETLLFNVDGSTKGSPGFAGIGGVLRDQNGKVFCSFSLYVGWQEAVMAEILAIAKACDLCASKPQLKDRKIVISSDCLVAV